MSCMRRQEAGLEMSGTVMYGDEVMFIGSCGQREVKNGLRMIGMPFVSSMTAWTCSIEPVAVSDRCRGPPPLIAGRLVILAWSS